MSSPRKTAPDLIRVLAATAVILMHVTALVYYELDNIGYYNWLVSNILNWGFKWSTPVFVMISGYFLLNSTTALDPKTFFRRRFGRLLIPYLSWSLFYYLFNHHGPYSFSSLLEFLDLLWRSSTSYHLYFINVMLGLYLVTPFIKKRLLGRRLGFSVLIFFLYSFLYLVGTTYFGLPQASNIFTWFLSYLGYYLAGYWLGKIKKPKRPILYLLLAATILAISILITRKTYFLFGNQEMQTVLVKHFSPTILIASLSLFYVVINQSNQALRHFSWLARLSKYSLGVYLVHPFWISIYSHLTFSNYLYQFQFGLWLIFMIVSTIITSFLSVILLSKIPYLRDTV